MYYCACYFPHFLQTCVCANTRTELLNKRNECGLIQLLITWRISAAPESNFRFLAWEMGVICCMETASNGETLRDWWSKIGQNSGVYNRRLTLKIHLINKALFLFSLRSLIQAKVERKFVVVVLDWSATRDGLDCTDVFELVVPSSPRQNYLY